MIGARPNVCLISDRNSGLLAAIRKLQQGEGRGHPIWPDVQNKWCIRYMGANFHERFKNKDLMKLFKRLCLQNQQRKFNVLWQMLDKMTAELAQARASGSRRGEPEESRASGSNSGRPGQPSLVHEGDLFPARNPLYSRLCNREYELGSKGLGAGNRSGALLPVGDSNRE